MKVKLLAAGILARAVALVRVAAFELGVLLQLCEQALCQEDETSAA
jgi:hypothetical protein